MMKITLQDGQIIERCLADEFRQADGNVKRIVKETEAMMENEYDE